MRNDPVSVGLVLLALPAALAVAGIGSYLLGLSAAALFAPRTAAPAAHRRRFAVLIPAHDEASLIERVLHALRAQTYPKERFDVFVVADNCGDETAAIAARAGAIVHERRDDLLRAKGHALRWLLERVRARGPYDAYVVFDADSVMSADFLERMNARLEAGSRVLQAHYRVLNPRASSVSALREAAFASLHYLRPMGRAALGLSCGLKGNGMCFDAATLDRHGWASVGLAEDVELHLALVRAGERVDFVPEATVWADMPTTLAAAKSQNVRWEQGRIGAARSDVGGLLREGLARRSAVEVDAAVEQLILPVSVGLAAGAAATLLAFLGGSTVLAAVALFGTAAIGVHVVAGLVAVRAPARTYLALAAAPAYIAWKVLLYARALAAPADVGWVRTRRP